MTAHKKKPSKTRMERLLKRLRARYDGYPLDAKGRPFERDTPEADAWHEARWPGRVDADYLRYWLSNSNDTDADFQAMAEYNAKEGRWSVARFCRLMCFTSKTQREWIR